MTQEFEEDTNIKDSKNLKLLIFHFFFLLKAKGIWKKLIPFKLCQQRRWTSIYTFQPTKFNKRKKINIHGIRN